MIQKISSCDETQCFIVAEHFSEFFTDDTRINKFDQVLVDISKIYDNAILIGAVGASKYILPPVEPRVTFDIDLIIEKQDFEDFLDDEIPEEKRSILDASFKTSDSALHSLKHIRTGIYVDLVSSASQSVRQKLIRYILDNRRETTNILTLNGNKIEILKPEMLIVMKLNRYAKNPRTEKGLADRLDTVKILKSYYHRKDFFDPEKIRMFLNRREIPHLDEILDDVNCEMRQI